MMSGVSATIETLQEIETGARLESRYTSCTDIDFNFTLGKDETC